MEKSIIFLLLLLHSCTSEINSEAATVADFCDTVPQKGSKLHFRKDTSDNLKRLECPAGLTLSIVIEYEKKDNSNYRKTEHGAFIDCNHTYHRVASSVEGKFFEELTQKIKSVSCEDLGQAHSACSIPWDNNAMRTGNTYTCTKGNHLVSVEGIGADGKSFAVHSYQLPGMGDMTCEPNGWRIHGTTYTNVTVTGFLCWDVYLDADANCTSEKIKAVGTHFAYDAYSKTWWCPTDEYMTVNGKLHPTSFDRKLFCKKNDKTGVFSWAWKGYSENGTDAFIPEGAKVECVYQGPFCAPVPQYGSQLVYQRNTPDKLKRLGCRSGRKLSMVIEYANDNPEYRKTEHAAFIDCNNTYHHISSCTEGKFFSEQTQKIKSVTCEEDRVATHKACTVPWDNNAERIGNKYACKKGNYFVIIKAVDAEGKEFGVSHYFGYTGIGEMTCEETGWRIHGTNFTAAKVTSFLCWDVKLREDPNCDRNKIKGIGSHFNFDTNSKIWTCADGYMTVNGQKHPKRYDRKLYCRKDDQTGAYGWAWRGYCDDESEEFLPEQATVACKI